MNEALTNSFANADKNKFKGKYTELILVSICNTLLKKRLFAAFQFISMPLF